MIERLPYYYRKSKIVKDFYDAVQTILDKADTDIDTADKRLFIITTDDFTLHEKDVSLNSAPDMDAETRRARVISRLRGNGVLTVEALKELVKLYEPSGADVTELYDNYTVVLDFFSRDGAPKNIIELIKAIYDVIPAHLALRYEMGKDTEASTLYFAGGVQICRRMSVPLQKRTAYGDIKTMSYGDIKGKPYANILQFKEG